MNKSPENPNSYYRRAAFLTSAPVITAFPLDEGFEVAFAGRSNAGKSSALNRLTQQKQLARISKTPGRTQAINFFMLDEIRRLVDLPGYGYAKIAADKQKKWQQLLGWYLLKRRTLCGIVILMDSRHLFTELDLQMISLAKEGARPIHLLLTKADKLSRNESRQAYFKAKKQCQELQLGDIPITLFSTFTGEGLEALQAQLNQWFDL